MAHMASHSQGGQRPLGRPARSEAPGTCLHIQQSLPRPHNLQQRPHIPPRQHTLRVSALFSSPQAQPFSSWQETGSSSEREDLGWRTDFSSHYSLGQLLGQGSFGAVHAGTDKHTGKNTAVKVLPKTRGKLSKEKTLEKLAREVDVLERLQSCPGVIALEDVFEDADNVMIVTELCSGGDLQGLSEVKGALNERALALVAAEVLKIVKACHDAGLLHGDVKPANFCLKHWTHNPIVSPAAYESVSPPSHEHFYSHAASARSTQFSWWLKAIDFGCSQQLPSGSRKLSKRSGTPVFMAPEIYNREYGAEADMWSFGIMLYQLYARRFPFWDTMEGCKASKLEEVTEKVLQAPISLDYGPWLRMSPEGRSFMCACLQRDPQQRLTVQCALTHPWLQMQLQQAPQSTQSTQHQQHQGAEMQGPVMAVRNNVLRVRPAVHAPQHMGGLMHNVAGAAA